MGNDLIRMYHSQSDNNKLSGMFVYIDLLRRNIKMMIQKEEQFVKATE